MRWRRPKSREQDLYRELRAHLELEAEEQRDSGLTPEQARDAARRAFGNVTFVQEEVRRMWGWIFFERFLQDLRYAARILRKNPGFTAVAVVSLGLGIGANTSVFSIADALLLKALPVSHPEQLRILTWIRQGNGPIGLDSHSGYSLEDEQGRQVDGSFSYPAYQLFRRDLPQFSDLIAFAPNQFNVTAAGTTDSAYGQYVSGNYFTGLGAQALLGRPILPEDDAPGRPGVAVLTHAYWSSRFSLDPGILNRVIVVNRQSVTVVGVMPPSFQGAWPGRSIGLFVPMSMVPATSPPYYGLAEPQNWWVQIFGRLKPGVSDPAASAAVRATLAHHIESYTGSTLPATSRPQIVLEPGSRGVGLLRSQTRKAVYILAAISSLVLLIACVNLANLLLARYAARSREIATRLSIGASRGRLVWQMLAECLLLAAASALSGLLLARPLSALLLHFFSGTSTLGIEPHLDARALAFAFSVSIVTALLFGTMPAWRATQVNIGRGLKEGALSGRGPRLPFHGNLVSIQIALSLLLLVGTGLFLRTLMRLAAVDLGFETGNLLTFQTDPGRSGYRSDQSGPLYRRLEERIAAIPGVEAVGISQLPLIGGVVTNGSVRLPGDDQRKRTWFLDCSDSFLSTMKIPIVSGRGLSHADFDLPIRSAVVNETFVKRYLAGANAVGQVFYPPDWEQNGRGPAPIAIVGVARDAHYRGVRDEVPPTAYLPYALRPPGDSTMVFAIRTRGTPLSIGPAVREAVAGVDRNLPVAEMRTERDQIERSLGTERLIASLVSAFGGIEVILAAIGLYGVTAFSVARRTPEIGVRMALGAQRGAVQWLVLRQSLFMTLLGILAGVPAALLLSRLVETFLYGVKPNDVPSIAGAVIVMSAVAALAAWIPARRASRIDPMAALRNE